jgi:hypothetical protein
MFNAKLVGFDLGSKLAAVSKLVGVNTGKDLDIEKMTTDLRMAPTGLEAKNFQAVVPSLGTLVGNGTIDAKNELDFKMGSWVAPLEQPAAPRRVLPLMPLAARLVACSVKSRAERQV